MDLQYLAYNIAYLHALLYSFIMMHSLQSLPSSTVAYEISTRSGNGDGERLDWCWLLKTSNFSNDFQVEFFEQKILDLPPPSPTNPQSPPQNYIHLF